MGKMACFLLWESMLDFVAMNKVSQEGNLQCHLLFGSGGQQQTSSICCSFITQDSDHHFVTNSGGTVMSAVTAQLVVVGIVKGK
ncbi:hypothetical protein Patl1_14783 [Pistacia atlantica]|uniref:Uncharacterized protein n=1 Tax=Pistacia atlantica TaxID=434234 RepID=A0ACC1ATN7_9ROSI|nr:hypothetical protein Patl1_14783 [Pistacia atlantica]